MVKGSVRRSSLEDSKSEAVEDEPFGTFVDPWVERPESFEWEFFRVDTEVVDFGRFFFLVLVAVDDLRMMLILSIVYLMGGESGDFYACIGIFSGIFLLEKASENRLFPIFASD